MPTEDAYSSGHLVLSHFGTCMCSNVETNLSWTCLVSGPLKFEHPSVILFCLEPCQSSCEEHGTIEHYKNHLVHGRSQTINTAQLPDCKSTVITSRPQLAWSSRISCTIREKGTSYCLVRSPYRPYNFLSDYFKRFSTYSCPRNLLESRTALRNGAQTVHHS